MISKICYVAFVGGIILSLVGPVGLGVGIATAGLCGGLLFGHFGL